MSAEQCRAVIVDCPVVERAPRLDDAFPACACEPWALTEVGGPGVANGELVARILTSPDQYDEATSTILTQKLTHLYSLGLSVIRQGASDAEILGTIEELMTKAVEPRNLVGAVIIGVQSLRDYVDGDVRWFGVYATDDRGKVHHVDVLGTKANGNTQKKRRYRLANDMLQLVVFENEPAELLKKLRSAGI